MTTQQLDVIQSLPAHLQPFVAVQDYDKYTPRDHAIWRFLLHQLKYSLKDSAHPSYFLGLAKTGICTECIPRIEDINQSLNELGWQAAAVDGFLPPAIFMEFQARKVLAIALNIRSFEHMLYTPAPDIIHESAGHAPFLVDIDYAEFLQRFGELGMQAIVNQHDVDIYEAVRQLSIVKENAAATPAQVEQAQNLVETIQGRKVPPSEANLLARLHWWTVEYGLVGDTHNYAIYGAGLLSSLSESQSCINDRKVTKLPLTLNAVYTAYDITQPQPQLFVTQSCRHLSQVLEEYGRHMGCQKGGPSALDKALKAQSINHATYNSGLQVAGKISRVIRDAVGNAIYLNTEGATQLAYKNVEIVGHGIDHHSVGFGSPIGKLRAIERCLSNYTIDELKRHNIAVNNTVSLYFLSGITVTGYLKQILRRDQKNILFTFERCSVTDVDGNTLFDPEWGVYDMAVGDSIVSVAGGSADLNTYPLYEAPSEQVTAEKDYDQKTQAQFALYAELRTLRETGGNASTLAASICNMPDADWLLCFEALELIYTNQEYQDIADNLRSRLAQESGDNQVLVESGLARLGINIR